MSCRLGQKLFKVFEQVGRSVEKVSHLSVNVLNWLGLSLIRLQNFKELLVDVRLLCKSVLGEFRDVSAFTLVPGLSCYPPLPIWQPTHLDLIHVADCMIELDRASLHVALLAW